MVDLSVHARTTKKFLLRLSRSSRTSSFLNLLIFPKIRVRKYFRRINTYIRTYLRTYGCMDRRFDLYRSPSFDSRLSISKAIGWKITRMVGESCPRRLSRTCEIGCRGATSYRIKGKIRFVFLFFCLVYY